MNRFIPTPVGNGAGRAAWAARGAIHPHACGERYDARQAVGHRGDSSPRLWGTAGTRATLLHHPRFIPTPVGNG